VINQLSPATFKHLTIDSSCENLSLENLSVQVEELNLYGYSARENPASGFDAVLEYVKANARMRRLGLEGSAYESDNLHHYFQMNPEIAGRFVHLSLAGFEPVWNQAMQRFTQKFANLET